MSFLELMPDGGVGFQKMSCSMKYSVPVSALLFPALLLMDYFLEPR
jgi:hypothetical protein